MKLFKLLPAYKDYIWGGAKLKTDYGKQTDLERIAESWELSCHPDGESVIANGARAGETLAALVAAEGAALLGSAAVAANRGNSKFPILIKLIDAKESLSIQAHPDDAFAEKREGSSGKTEMWLVLDSDDGAYLYYGLKTAATAGELTERIKNGTIEEILNKVFVKKGDAFFIAPGTIHAIGAGVTIAEVQQSSNITYRLYDYGRLGADGAPRELHVEKGVACAVLAPSAPIKPKNGFLASCAYFSVKKRSIKSTGFTTAAGFVSGKSFLSVLVLEGNGKLKLGGEQINFVKGDSIFIAANAGEYAINGDCEILETSAGE